MVDLRLRPQRGPLASKGPAAAPHRPQGRSLCDAFPLSPESNRPLLRGIARGQGAGSGCQRPRPAGWHANPRRQAISAIRRLIPRRGAWMDCRELRKGVRRDCGTAGPGTPRLACGTGGSRASENSSANNWGKTPWTEDAIGSTGQGGKTPGRSWHTAPGASDSRSSATRSTPPHSIRVIQRMNSRKTPRTGTATRRSTANSKNTSGNRAVSPGSERKRGRLGEGMGNCGEGTVLSFLPSTWERGHFEEWRRDCGVDIERRDCEAPCVECLCREDKSLPVLFIECVLGEFQEDFIVHPV